MTQIIAVLNQKGGTGKTTTTLALGCRFAQLGHKTLLIDVDPQANLTLGLGVDAARLEKSSYDVMVRDLPAEQAIVSTNIALLNLLPGKTELANTDINLGDRHRRQVRLKDALEPIKDAYDFILIDCPPSFGLLPVNALVAADGVLIPMVPNYFALEGLKQVQESIASIRVELNPGLKITGILFSLVDSRLKITQPAMDMVRQYYPDQPFATAIHNCAKINESQILGDSIFTYAPKSRAALEYGQLADEVLARIGFKRLDRLAVNAFQNLFRSTFSLSGPIKS